MSEIDPNQPPQPTPPLSDVDRDDARNVAMKLLGDEKVWVAVGTAVVAVLVLFGASPEKQAQAMTVIVAVGGIGIAVVAARGYRSGKAVENTVPAGRVAASKAAPASTVNVTVTPPVAVIPTPENAVNMTNQPATPPQPMPPGGGGRLWSPLLILAVLLPLAAGCGTSKAFKACTSTLGELAEKEYTPYVQADLTITATVRAERLTDAAELKSLAGRADVERIDAVWQRVRGPYLAYVRGDPGNAIGLPPATPGAPAETLADLFAAEVTRVDKCIASERKRRAQWWNVFAQPAPGPPPPSPTTAPTQ